MPTPIFTPPAGLLGLLGTKTLGQNPSLLSQEVSPSVELFPFWAYGQSYRRNTTISGTITVVGSVAVGALVPQGKVWVPLLHVATCLSIGAGDSGRIRAAAVVDSNAVVLQVGSVPAAASTFGGILGASSIEWWLSPFIAQPGTLFGGFVESITVATTGIQMTSTLTYIEFDI